MKLSFRTVLIKQQMFKIGLANPTPVDILNYELVQPLNRILKTSFSIRIDQYTYQFISELKKDIGERNFPRKFITLLTSFVDYYNLGHLDSLNLDPPLSITDLKNINKVPTTICAQIYIFKDFIPAALEITKHVPADHIKFAPFIKNVYHRTGLIQFIEPLCTEYQDVISSQSRLFNSPTNHYFHR